MSHADTIAALYDHERDGAATGGRRRVTHDWGADDLFDGTRYRGADAAPAGRFVREADRDARYDDVDGRFDRDARYDDVDGRFDRDARYDDVDGRFDRDARYDDVDSAADRDAPYDHFDELFDDRGRGGDRHDHGDRGRAAYADDRDHGYEDRHRGFDDRDGHGTGARPRPRRRERVVDDWFAPTPGRSVTIDLDALGSDEHAAGDARDPRAHGAVSSNAPTLELDLPFDDRPSRRAASSMAAPPAEAIRRAERAAELAHRRPAPSLMSRIGDRPDHVAAWACALGVLLVLVAMLS